MSKTDLQDYIFFLNIQNDQNDQNEVNEAEP